MRSSSSALQDRCERQLSRRKFVQAAAATVGVVAHLGSERKLAADGFSEYADHDAVALAELVRQNHVKPEELLEAAIQRVEALNPKLKAVVTKMYDEAHDAIRRGLPDGPFRGVPFLIKDIGAPYAGVRYTAGSRLYGDYISPEDDELVKRYKKAGLVTIGRTNTPEFGLNVTTESVLLGPAHNPWDLSRSTGGSSGGSAAAVAARMVPAAHGGDGGGSIRIPASCCGIFGLKPSRGRMPTGPDSGEIWEGFVTKHVLSVSVRDSAALLDATSAPEVGAPYGIPAPRRPFLQEVGTDPGKLRIAWSAKGGADGIHPDCVAAVTDAAKLCEHLRHVVEEVTPDIDYDELRGAFDLVIQVHTAAMLDNVARDLGKELTPDLVEPATWSTAERGRRTSAVQFAKAKPKLNRATRALGRFFNEYDVFLTPTLGAPPMKLGFFDTVNLPYDESWKRIFDFIPYTWLHNVAGTPAMSVPSYWNAEGLPIGVQFAGRYADETTLFRLASQLERARPWRAKVPSV